MCHALARRLVPKKLAKAGAMSESQNRETGRRLQGARKDAGLSVEEAAAGTGQSADTVRSHEKGARGLTRRKAERYARLYGSEVEYLLGLSKSTRGVRVNPTLGMEVMGSVMAGAFREGLEEQAHERERLPVQSDTAYAEKSQFALRVQGPSMNLVYPDGSYVICVRTEDADPRIGDHVVIQRERSGLYEFTLKELCRDAQSGRLYLAPRSSDPRYQSPVDLVGGQVEIVAIVIGSYIRRERRGPAAL